VPGTDMPVLQGGQHWISNVQLALTQINAQQPYAVIFNAKPNRLCGDLVQQLTVST
jgi:hypothetical protein